MNSPPVLFLIFNRPNVTEKALSAIRKAQPKQLFVAGDGPRRNRNGEREACELTRMVATQIDWNCEVKTLFRDENLGCERAVSSAITWLFEHVEQGIILEDDCVAAPTFFRFCDEMLKKYADDERVGAITGDNFQRGSQRGKSSYYFSKYPHCWGWATWRSCWNNYETEMFHAAEELQRTIDNFSNVNGESVYWRRIFERTQARQIDSWAYRWMYATWKHRLLTVTPQRNLVENIGFGDEATHTTGDGSSLPGLASIEFPLTHSVAVEQDCIADAFVAKKIYHIKRFMPLRRAFHKCRRLLRDVQHTCCKST